MKQQGWGNGSRIKAQKEEAETYDEEQQPALPWYRFYGVRRWVRPWKEKLNLFLGRALVIQLFILFFAVAGFSVVAFFLYFPEIWIKLLVAILAAFILVVNLTRSIRRRRKFYRKLKRLCTANKCKLQFRPRFIRSSKGSSDREDVRIESGTCVYYLRYLGTKKYGVSIYMEPDGQVKLVKKPIANKFSMIFNIQPKVRYATVRGTESVQGNKRVLYGFVVDPVCQSLYYKSKDGGYEATGNGGEHFGMTAFTVNGLLEAVKASNAHPNQSIPF